MIAKNKIIELKNKVGSKDFAACLAVLCCLVAMMDDKSQTAAKNLEIQAFTGLSRRKVADAISTLKHNNYVRRDNCRNKDLKFDGKVFTVTTKTGQTATPDTTKTGQTGIKQKRRTKSMSIQEKILIYLQENYKLNILSEFCDMYEENSNSFDWSTITSKMKAFVKTLDVDQLKEIEENKYFKSNNVKMPCFGLLKMFSFHLFPRPTKEVKEKKTKRFIKDLDKLVISITDYVSCRFATNFHKRDDFKKAVWELLREHSKEDVIFFFDAAKDCTTVNFKNQKWFKNPIYLVKNIDSLIATIKEKNPNYTGKNISFSAGAINQYRPFKMQVERRA